MSVRNELDVEAKVLAALEDVTIINEAGHILAAPS